MNAAWKGGKQSNKKPTTGIHTRLGSPGQSAGASGQQRHLPEPPKPSKSPSSSVVPPPKQQQPQQSPVKSTKSPWSEAEARGKQQNRPMLAKGKLETAPGRMTGLFSADEVNRLGKRFRKLDKDSSGSLSLEEFLSLPDLAENPLVNRVVEIFDLDRNGEVDFKEFIQGISTFTVAGNKDSRLRFAFRIYDIDNDGFISNGELFQVMKMMVGTGMKDTQLQHLVDTTIIYGDKNEDGKISYQEFCDIINGGSNFHKKMLIEGI